MLAVLAYFVVQPVPADGGPDPVTKAAAWMRDHGFPDLSFSQAELLANMCVFIPIGFVAFFVLPPRRRAWAIAVGPTISLTIEIVQYLFFPTRTATLTDVVANTLGSLAGVGLAWFFTAVRAAPTGSAPPQSEPDSMESHPHELRK